jgi:hypothetical protein
MAAPLSNADLNKLLESVRDELKSIKDIAEPDLTKWSDWNQYVEEQQTEVDKIVDSFSLDTGVTKKYVDDTMNYSYEFSEPKYQGAWTTRVDEYIKAEHPLEAKPAPKQEKVKRTRSPSIKKDDRVNTPKGPGNVWGIDRDGTVCVELDNDPGLLHEFEKKELKKVK